LDQSNEVKKGTPLLKYTHLLENTAHVDTLPYFKTLSSLDILPSQISADLQPLQIETGKKQKYKKPKPENMSI